MKPGEIITEEGHLMLNEGKNTIEIEVTNLGDRPVQVGSHFPFHKVNALLSFDRSKTEGMHLDIPSGTGVRFEPGEMKKVSLVTCK